MRGNWHLRFGWRRYSGCRSNDRYGRTHRCLGWRHRPDLRRNDLDLRLGITQLISNSADIFVQSFKLVVVILAFRIHSISDLVEVTRDLVLLGHLRFCQRLSRIDRLMLYFIKMLDGIFDLLECAIGGGILEISM